METKELVKQRILSLCAEYQISLNHLSSSAGIPPTTLYSIVGIKSKKPGIVTIKYLCDALGISLCDFFDTEEFRQMEQHTKR